MLRTIFLTAIAVSIAVLGGAASVWYALLAQEGIGAVTVGAWTAYPELGSPDADPYSNARVAREGLLALGRAEGLSFAAAHDSAGEPLRRQCGYTVEGRTPPARFWTLYAADSALFPLPASGPRPGAIHSQQLVRLPGNVVSVAVGPHALPGNWIASGGVGPMTLVLTLYDTPIASSTGMSDIELPQVIRGRCDG